jgi:hypothetical protein
METLFLARNRTLFAGRVALRLDTVRTETLVSPNEGNEGRVVLTAGFRRIL